MLVNDPQFNRVVDAGGSPAPARLKTWRQVRPTILGLIAFGIAFTVGMQALASMYGVRGPFMAVANDLFSTPTSSEVYFAGLAVALVGMTNRVRISAIVAAVVLQAFFIAERLLRGQDFALGDGPLYVLLALAIVATFWWTGEQRTRAMPALTIGLAIPLLTKLGDTWLDISAVAHPRVLDPYLRVADHALGDPAWLAGQALEFMGPSASLVVHLVYIELPIAAMAVAIWQLAPYARGVAAWPTHYLVRTFIGIGLIGPLIYFLFPVVGPVFAYGPSGNGWQADSSWPMISDPSSFSVGWMDFDSETPRNCMPSLHTAWALAIFIHTRRGPAWIRYGGTFWLLATLMATLGFGYHYGVDLIAGAVLTLTIESALRDPHRGWDAARLRLVVTGTTIFAGLLLMYRFLPAYMAEHPFVFGPLLIGALTVVVAMFYGQFFSTNESMLARWARQPVRG